MSGKNFLLDANIVIALFADDENVTKQIEKPIVLFVPTIVFGELYYGAELSAKKTENIKRLEVFTNICRILSISFQSAAIYGQIKSQLKKSGKPIPDNDIWIAAIARENNLPLISRDSHFKHVRNLKLIEW